MLNTQFILTGCARSGSTLLATALWQHPNARMYFEVFHDTPLERGAVDEYRYKEESEAAEMVELIFSDRYDPYIKAAGFKLFYHQARKKPSIATAWKSIRKDQKIKIIWLVRNWFDTLVSLKTALRSDVWWIPNKPGHIKPDVPPFRISIKECTQYFTQQEYWSKKLIEDIRTHQCLVVRYKDLSCLFDATMNQVYDFLDLPDFSPQMHSKKQRRRAPCSQVVNYEALKQHFKNSQYAKFFESESIQ